MNEMSRDLELEKQIDAYIKGKLSEKEAHQLWEKLLKRPDYIELLETELGLKSIMQDRSTGDASQSPARENTVIYSLHKSWKWMAAAAAVALLVVSVNVFQADTNRSVTELAEQNFNLAENLSSAQILRDQKSEVSTSDSLLNRGFEAAISGEVSRALQVYDEIIEEYGDKPAAVQAYLNKGIIQYNSGDFGKSIQSFEAVIQNVKDKKVVEEKAYWYMGNAYINIENLSDARDAIHNAYAMDGIYRKPAFRLLRKLDYQLDNIDLDNFEQQMKEG